MIPIGKLKPKIMAAKITIADFGATGLPEA
jgi:hypothetical protein